MKRRFAEILATLPSADDLAGIELTLADGAVVLMENKPGSQGSVRLYRYLLQSYGRIDVAAAAEGLVLYAEHAEDARHNPGKHPNIDRLIAIETGGPAISGRLLKI